MEFLKKCFVGALILDALFGKSDEKKQPEAKRRGIIWAVFWTFLTCGLYGAYWFVKVTSEIRILLDDDTLVSGIAAFLYSILTCGLYLFYWAYQMGNKVERLKGKSGATGWIYLAILFFGFGIINLILIQDAINDKIEGVY